VKGAAYPYCCCNFETFTNSDMLEIESLGPLATLQPGESTSHPETWHLAAAPAEIDPEDENSLAKLLTPLLRDLL
ncbi:MAG: hypothetical protein WCO97_04790, partial [bacterium]